MRFIYNKTTTVMITVFLFFSYSMVVANENKFPPIMFKKGEVQFNINTPVIAGDKTQFSVESMSTEKMATKRHMIMQFQKLPTDSDKRKLAKNGIKLLSYIPKNAYWVSIETRGVQYARSNLVNSDGESGHVLWSPPSHYKLSKSVEERNFSTFSLDGDKVKLLLSFYKDVSQQEAESALNKGVQVTTVIWKDKHLAEISINKKLIDALAKIDVVKGMEVVQKNSVDNVTSAQRIGVDIIKGNPLNLDGTGVSVGVWDGGRVGVHQDLTGRVTDITSSGTSVSNHATHVTGTIIGRGLGNTSAEGMAIGATVLNGYYNDSYLGQFRAASADNSIQLSNWSFGYDVGWSIDGTTHRSNDFSFGSYRAEAATVDDIIADEGALLFKSAGNDRDDCNVNNSADCDGDGDGYDTISGNGNAKNIITVGATTDADTMSSFSGWGPTDDHRVKPDLCANGVGVYSTLPNHNYGSMNGTSMASPSAAGAGTLLYQHYKAVYGGFPSDAAIIKGVMIHTASDFATVGPDAQCGWGLINAKKAADVISDQHIKTDSISQSGTEKTIQINVPSSASVMKVSLVWTDVPGSSTGSINLVNNLDLRLVDPNGVEHLPWVLNSANQYRTATRGDNDRDNVEQVSVNNPAGGNWTVKVINDGIPQGPQNYVLVFDYDEASSEDLPSISSPANGSTLSGSTQTFSWSANGTSVSQWWLYIGRSVGASDYFNDSLGTRTSVRLGGFSTDGSSYFFRLWYKEGGTWKSSDSRYTAVNNNDTQQSSEKITVR